MTHFRLEMVIVSFKMCNTKKIKESIHLLRPNLDQAGETK